MRSFLRGAAVFAGAMLLQWWWNSHLVFWGAAPQFLLVLSILLGARRDPLLAMLAGFGWGLSLDCSRAALFGSAALTLTLAAYVASLARRQADLSSAPPAAALTAALSFGAFLFQGLVGSIFSSRFTWPGWTPFLVSPFLNAAAAAAGSVLVKEDHPL